MNPIPIDYLRALNPHPPQQGEVGASPISFLHQLPKGTFDPTQLKDYDLHRSLSRTTVREICTNKSIHPLTAYAVAMAWGGQRTDHFQSSCTSRGLSELLTALRDSKDDRAADFSRVQKAAGSITGLGISFYTKLLYFFRPTADAYILDKWTAMADNILHKTTRIQLGQRDSKGHFSPDPHTTGVAYGAFCERLDQLARLLWPTVDNAGQFAEAAIFDVGRGRGPWRNFVKAHFEDLDVGIAIKRGSVCLTTQADFESGRLVLHREVSRPESTEPPPPPPPVKVTEPRPPVRHRTTICLNRDPAFYIGIKERGNNANIGYISTRPGGRSGEICVYNRLLELLRDAGYTGALLVGNMRHGGPENQHAGNIQVQYGTPKAAIQWLTQFFDIQDP